jgi:hypothetical protein
VQDGDQHQRDRLAEVERAADRRVSEDLVRFPQVGLNVRGPAGRRGTEQRPGVRQDERVLVCVYNAVHQRDARARRFQYPNPKSSV